MLKETKKGTFVGFSTSACTKKGEPIKCIVRDGAQIESKKRLVRICSRRYGSQIHSQTPVRIFAPSLLALVPDFDPNISPFSPQAHILTRLRATYVCVNAWKKASSAYRAHLYQNAEDNLESLFSPLWMCWARELNIFLDPRCNYLGWWSSHRN